MSPKTGRPKIENPNTINLMIRINKDLNLRLNEYCKINSITKGEVVRNGIEKVLDEKK